MGHVLVAGRRSHTYCSVLSARQVKSGRGLGARGAGQSQGLRGHHGPSPNASPSTH